MDGLKLDIKNLFFVLSAPKLSPMNPDRGMHGDSIFSCFAAMIWVSKSKLGAILEIIKVALKNTIIPINISNDVIFKLTWLSIKAALFVFNGVNTATIALCKGPFIPPIMITKNPGIMAA